MGHNNRARLTISTEQSDIDTVLAQRAYHGHDNVVVIGTVVRGTGEHGLLVQSTVTKQYWLWDGAYSSLDARKVNAALGIDGRVNNGGHKTAGRKPAATPLKAKTFRLPEHVIDWLKKQPNETQAIVDLVTQKINADCK